MGRTYIPAYSERNDRKRLIAELTKGMRTGAATRKCLTHCLRGNVLWTVWEINPKDSEQAQRFIGCDLLNYGGKKHGWGYKNMDEGCEPCYYSCPIKYLEMVPVPDSQYAKNWREEILSNYSERKTLTDALRRNYNEAKAKGGKCVVTLKGTKIDSMTVTSLKPLRGKPSRNNL